MWRWPVGRRKQRDRENFSFLLAQFVKEGVLTVAGAEKGFILLLRDDAYGAEPPTTWTILEQDGPNHLGLWYNALPEYQTALTTSDCAPLQDGQIYIVKPAAGLQGHGRSPHSLPQRTARCARVVPEGPPLIIPPRWCLGAGIQMTTDPLSAEDVKQRRKCVVQV